MNLGILFGGNSLEHEISIVTAYGLRKKLDDTYKIHMLYMDMNHQVYLANKLTLDDFKNNKLKKLKKVSFIDKGIKACKIDCMILALHGENGEDGLGASICRFYHIPFVGSDILASSICMDKYISYRYLSKNGIPMIKTQLYTYKDFIEGTKPKEYPCILKPVYGGSSIGIFVCIDELEFDDKIIKAFEISKEFILQPFYEDLEEYNLALYEHGYSSLEKIEKKDEIFSFDNKYNDSFKLMHQTLYEDDEEESFQRIARKTYNLLKCSGIVRIDFFKLNGKIYLNEVNILPGALASYLFKDFINVINLCIKEAVVKKEFLYSKGTFLEKSSIRK